jgi:hypothetical protein
MSGKRERPRRLFRVRRSGSVVSVGPDFGDQRPHYLDCVDELLRRHQREILEGAARGLRYTIQVRHDDWCPALTEGGCCNCNCVVDLVELPPAPDASPP